MSLREFVRTSLLTAAVVWLAVGGYILSQRPPAWEDFILLGIGGLEAGFFMGGIRYLILHLHDVATMRFPADELGDGERVLMESTGSIVHYRTGRTTRFWEAVGGRLYLTNRRVVFITFRGQWWSYRISLKLDSILRAETCPILNTFAGGLCLTTAEGKDLFTFGAVRELEVERWAAAILLARYRAHPDRDWSQETV